MDCSPPGLSVHGNSPGKNTGMGCHALLQGIFPAQGSNPDLPHCRWILYHLNHQGSSRILEWVAYPFSRVRSRSWIRVSLIANSSGLFARWATTEASYQLCCTTFSRYNYVFSHGSSSCHKDIPCFFLTFVKKALRRRQWHPTPVLLPGKSHRWRSLVGWSPWGR